jgi:hypothetical protein
VFLTNKTYNLENFLQALSFIPPKGTTVAYFITPQGMEVPQGSGFAPANEIAPKPEDESITYVRTEPIQKQDQATTPAEYSVFDTPTLGRRQPTPNILPPVTEPDDLESPFVKVLSESKMYGTDIKLLEDYKCFQKGTVFHCIPGKLQEMEWAKPPGISDRMFLGSPDIKGFKYGQRWSHDEFPAPNHDKILKDAWALYKEGFDEDEIVDEMLQQDYYRKNFKDKEKLGTEKELRDYVKDWVRTKADHVKWLADDDEKRGSTWLKDHPEFG